MGEFAIFIEWNLHNLFKASEMSWFCFYIALNFEQSCFKMSTKFQLCCNFDDLGDKDEKNMK